MIIDVFLPSSRPALLDSLIDDLRRVKKSGQCAPVGISRPHIPVENGPKGEGGEEKRRWGGAGNNNPFR